MGAIEKSIIVQAIRCNEPIPDNILNAPILQVGLHLYFQAFLDLDSERTHSNGVTPIPWTSIAEYAQVWDFDDCQRNDLFYLVKKMDEAIIKRIDAKTKASSG